MNLRPPSWVSWGPVGLTIFTIALAGHAIASGGNVEILEVDGMQIVLSAGAEDGVRVGMAASVTRSESVAGTVQEMVIAVVRVTSVDRASASAVVQEIGPGWVLEVGASVVFDEPLVPPAPEVFPLRIRTVPSGASVNINGSNRGTSPLDLKVERGEYRIEAAADGYRPQQAATTVPGDREVTLTLVPLIQDPPDGFESVQPNESNSPAASKWQLAEATKLRLHPAIRSRRSGEIFVLVPSGTYQVGCVSGDDRCELDEVPRKSRFVENPYWVGVHEVTVGRFHGFAAATSMETPPLPKYVQRDRHPVVNVAWDESVAYCNWVGGRLPSSDEWEIAARGEEKDSVYPWGNEPPRCAADVQAGARFDDARGCRPVGLGEPGPAEVGVFTPSSNGLFDMAGNVWEWCARGDLAIDVPGGAVDAREVRGGSWASQSSALRASFRGVMSRDSRSEYVGFRCVVDVPQGGAR